MSKKLKGNLILLITTIAWGSSFVAQRLGMSENTLTPTNFIAMRTLMGGIVLLPFIMFGKKNKPKEPIAGRGIIQKDDDGNIIKKYISIASAVRETGVNSKSIRDAAKGVQKHAGGFVWKYEDEEE